MYSHILVRRPWEEEVRQGERRNPSRSRSFHVYSRASSRGLWPWAAQA